MSMDKELTLKALRRLDEEIGMRSLPRVRMVAGGGAAMVLAHGFPGKTVDVDAVPTNADFETIKELAEKVAKELKIDHDWLNPYFQSFTVYLPPEATSRMESVYSGKNLQVDALGAEDILIMKLMAGRSKDRPHIRHLLKSDVDISIVEDRLHEMADKGLFKSLAEKAIDLLEELVGDL